MLNKIRKNLKDKAGFTLVELIVVLVILAILAALLVPALTGYIDKANKQKIVATTRQVVMAAQTETSEAYAKAEGGKLTKLTLDKNSKPSLQTIVELAEVGTYSGDTFIGKNGVSKVEITVTVDGKVNTVVVTQSGFKCTYDMNKTGDEQYKVIPAPATSGNPD